MTANDPDCRSREIIRRCEEEDIPRNLLSRMSLVRFFAHERLSTARRKLLYQEKRSCKQTLEALIPILFD